MNEINYNTTTPLGTLLRALGDLLVLNILWLFTSLPIITTGAASSAVFSVLLRRDRNGELPVIRTYFKNFAAGFGKSTLLWLLTLALAFVAWIDFRFALTFEGALRTLYLVLGAAIALSAAVIACLAIPQQALFENTFKNYLKNAFAAAFVAPWKFVQLVLLWFVPFWFVAIRLPMGVVAKFGVILFLWGFSGPAFLASHVLNKIFNKFMPEEEKDEQNGSKEES